MWQKAGVSFLPILSKASVHTHTQLSIMLLHYQEINTLTVIAHKPTIQGP